MRRLAPPQHAAQHMRQPARTFGVWRVAQEDGCFGPVRTGAPAGRLNDQNAEEDQRAGAMTGKRN